MNTKTRYRVTSANVAPHSFEPGEIVRFERSSRAGDRHLFRGASFGQWLAAEDVEEVVPRDGLGVVIRRGDVVTVIAWGAPVRLGDTGRQARVVSFTPAGNVALADTHYPEDPIARGRAVSPGMLAVARRDGRDGHEGNRP